MKPFEMRILRFAFLVCCLVLVHISKADDSEEISVSGDVLVASESLPVAMSTLACACTISEEALAEERAKAAEVKQQLEKLLQDAQDKVKDLQRAVERKKNDVVTAESVLKNCELDKTVATESLAKHKEVITKMGKELEGLKSQVQLANQKSALPPKCPPCPACAACATCAACPKCASTTTTSDSSEASACSSLPGNSTCSMPLCASLAASELKAAALFTYDFATVRVPDEWAKVGKPALNESFDFMRKTLNSSLESVVKPMYIQYVEPYYIKHVQPALDKSWKTCSTVYDEHLSNTVQLYIAPLWDECVSKAYAAFYTAYAYLDIEDLPQNLWLGFAKTVSWVLQGLEWLTDQVATSDPRLAPVAPAIVNGVLLVLLFVFRKWILGIFAAVFVILLSPLLLVVSVLQWVGGFFKKRKPKTAKKSKTPAAMSTNAAPPAHVAVASPESGRPPRAFPAVQSAQASGPPRGGKDVAVWGDGEPLSTQASLAALRAYEEAQDNL